ncbi:transporter associated domain-containing protein [Spirochaeta isovalerica]|uniref:CBS domain containing-hemolysin-like protein n=1 Tax=Spirochaeta isovalerica TaxID=150 RepID=A0A841RET0_9SPIO|nr:CBS domain containing-hemolysin-like protein [Spirochaeta isovalerica]
MFIASGNTDLEYLSHVLNLKLKKGNNQTLGGYICERMGVIPLINAEYRDYKLKYTVFDADKHCIKSVRIQLLEDPVH